MHLFHISYQESDRICETGASTGTPSEIEILIAENSQQLAILAMKQFDSDGCLQGATTN